MGTRFGRRAADGTYEYHDSKESLVAAERRDSSDARSGLFGLIGLLVGDVLTYIVLIKVGTDWPKWLRFGLVIAGAGGLAYVLAKFADLNAAQPQPNDQRSTAPLTIVVADSSG